VSTAIWGRLDLQVHAGPVRVWACACVRFGASVPCHVHVCACAHVCGCLCLRARACKVMPASLQHMKPGMCATKSRQLLREDKESARLQAHTTPCWKICGVSGVMAGGKRFMLTRMQDSAHAHTHTHKCAHAHTARTHKNMCTNAYTPTHAHT